MIYLNYVVFDMFRTSRCSSSERLVHAGLWYYIMHLYKQSGRCLVVFDAIKLSVQFFLKMNTWLFETCRRQYNWIKSLMKKKSVHLVGSSYTAGNMYCTAIQMDSWKHDLYSNRARLVFWKVRYLHLQDRRDTRRSQRVSTENCNTYHILENRNIDFRFVI